MRVPWLDGEYVGLDEWVSAARLIVLWEHVDAFLSDENKMLDLEKAQPDAIDEVTVEAVLQVWFAVDTPVSFEVRRDHVRASVDEFDNVAEELPVGREELLRSPGAFVDSGGTLHGGEQIAVLLARGIASPNPMPFLQRGTDELDRYRKVVVTGWYDPLVRGFEPHDVSRSTAQGWLDRAESVWRIVRRWCGDAAERSFDEREALRAEVDGLRHIMDDTARWIRDAGHPVKAGHLRRELNDPDPARACLRPHHRGGRRADR